METQAEYTVDTPNDLVTPPTQVVIQRTEPFYEVECPVCKWPGYYQSGYSECENDDCSASFRVQLALVVTVL